MNDSNIIESDFVDFAPSFLLPYGDKIKFTVKTTKWDRTHSDINTHERNFSNSQSAEKFWKEQKEILLYGDFYLQTQGFDDHEHDDRFNFSVTFVWVVKNPRTGVRVKMEFIDHAGEDVWEDMENRLTS